MNPPSPSAPKMPYAATREADEITGYPAVDVSNVRNADLERFTVDRLKKMLAALDGHSRV